MTIKKFINAVKMQTSDAAVAGTIQSLVSPPGRKARKSLVRLAEWYKELRVEDREMVAEALQEAAEMAVFEFFCLLDGVSVIEDTPDKGELELYFVKHNEERILLNDPVEDELHNLFNGLCQAAPQPSDKSSLIRPYDSGEAQELKSKLNSA